MDWQWNLSSLYWGNIFVLKSEPWLSVESSGSSIALSLWFKTKTWRKCSPTQTWVTIKYPMSLDFRGAFLSWLPQSLSLSHLFQLFYWLPLNEKIKALLALSHLTALQMFKMKTAPCYLRWKTESITTYVCVGFLDHFWQIWKKTSMETSLVKNTLLINK